jgi:hypothetical protein
MLLIRIGLGFRRAQTASTAAAAATSAARLPSYDAPALPRATFYFSSSTNCRDQQQTRFGVSNHLKAVEALAEYGQGALRPRKTSQGKWRRPSISARKAAALRKMAVLQGTYREAPLTSDEVEAGFVHFMPSWDLPGQKMLPGRPERKGNMAAKRVRRVATIEAQLAKQDMYMKKYRKALQDAKPTDFMDKLLGNQPTRFE